MSDTIIFPDVELWAASYLRNALSQHGFPGAYVSNRRGTQPVAVWVRRDGGFVRDRVLDVARLGVNVFHEGATDEGVSLLSRTVSALLRGAADGRPVCCVQEVSGPSPVPDTVPSRYMTYELTLRGLELS